MERGTFNIQGEKIPYKFYDNGVKTTLFAVHGVLSDMSFIGSIPKYIKNYNILTISLNKVNAPFTIEKFRKIIEEIALKKLRRTRVHLLLHSLAGIPGSDIAKNKKIRKVYYVDTIHPLISKSKMYELNRRRKERNSGKAKNKGIIDKFIQILDKTIGADSKYSISTARAWDALINSVFDDIEYWQNYLDENYKQTKEKATFIVGKVDFVISAPLFIKYVESIGKKPIVIAAIHSPIKRNIKEFVKVLNKHTPRKRSKLRKKIL